MVPIEDSVCRVTEKRRMSGSGRRQRRPSRPSGCASSVRARCGVLAWGPVVGVALGPTVGAFIVVTLQNYLASLEGWVTVITGTIFVLCVLAFRRGVVGEIAARVKR